MSIISVFKTISIRVSNGKVNLIDLDVDCVFSYKEREIFLCVMENIFVKRSIYMKTLKYLCEF